MIGLVRIYKVNGHYVVANSVDDAVRIFIEAENSNDEIKSVTLLSSGPYPDFAYIRKPDIE